VPWRLAKRVPVMLRKSAIGTGGTVTVIARITGHMATTDPITDMATATPTIGPITMVGVLASAFGLASRLTEKSTSSNRASSSEFLR
jgi:hypothetical protein